MPEALGSFRAAKRKERKRMSRRVLGDSLCMFSDGGKAEFVSLLGLLGLLGPPSFPGVFKSPIPDAEESRKGEVKSGDIWNGSQ